MNEVQIFVLIQMITNWMLIGIIWFNQIVHYPLYKKVKDGFIEYEKSHIKRTALLVGPLMLIEGASALFLVTKATHPQIIKLATANILLLLLIWISTFIFQVYQHQKLSIRFSNKVFQALLRTNWIRVVLWTAKGVVVIVILVALLK